MENKKVIEAKTSARIEAGEKVIYADLSFRVMAAVFEVHNQLGPGFTESIYEEAMAIELANQHIPFERQKVVEVYYKDRIVGTYRTDFVIDNKIVLELKAVSGLDDVFKQQLLAYLKATDLHLGILVNFGTKSVQSVRIVY
jgi:GxxExxY protein